MTPQKLISILLIFLITGCATRVAVKQDLMPPAEFAEKECYSYDTTARNMARNLPHSVGLGILGGLFLPLLVITLPAEMALQAADQAGLPIKCALTIDDAIKEAWTVSFFEETTAIWKQKKDEDAITIMAKPVGIKNGKCSIHNIDINKGVKGTPGKTYSYNAEICKDENGIPQLAKEISDEEIKAIKQQTAQQKCQTQTGDCKDTPSYP